MTANPNICLLRPRAVVSPPGISHDKEVGERRKGGVAIFRNADYMPSATIEIVAVWIVDQIRFNGFLDEDAGAARARRLFGEEFTLHDRASGANSFLPSVIASLEMFAERVSYDAVRRCFGQGGDRSAPA